MRVKVTLFVEVDEPVTDRKVDAAIYYGLQDFDGFKNLSLTWEETKVPRKEEQTGYDWRLW